LKAILPFGVLSLTLNLMLLNKNKINEIKLWLWFCEIDGIMTSLLQ
jgi:hypothetical protein